MPQVSHIYILFEWEDQEVTIRAAQFVVVTEEVACSHLTHFLSYRVLVPFDIISISQTGLFVNTFFEFFFGPGQALYTLV